MAVSADDNAQGGGGDTDGSLDGYGWYNPWECLWKVSVYVGKSDTANKNSNLKKDYYLVGGTSIYVKKSDWSVSSRTKFGASNKVQYYDGTDLSYRTSSPKIISHSSAPLVPVACGDTVSRVKSYFGDTNTLNMVLNALAAANNTSQEGLVSNLSFTLKGSTQKWDSSYILPKVKDGKLKNGVPWVIVYEPVVVARLKDEVTQLGFTATEFALAQSYGWYNFRNSGSNCQQIGKLTHQHLPTSVQLEYSWFGYPVYNVTNDSKQWSNDEIIKGGGWGMRFLDAQNVVIPMDFTTTINAVPSMQENSKTTISVNWRNYQNASYKNIPCAFYFDGKLIWSGNYDFTAYETKTQSFTVSLGWGTTDKVIKAQINYAGRKAEINPNDNEAVKTVKPKEYLDFSVSGLTFDKTSVYQGDTVTAKFVTKNGNGGKGYSNIPVEVIYNGSVVKTQTTNFAANGSNTHTVTFNAGTKIGPNDVTVRINWANRNKEANAANNGTSKTVNVAKYYDFAVSDLQVAATEYEDRQITVKCSTNNFDKYNAYSAVPVDLLYNGKIITTKKIDFPANTKKLLEFTLNTGEWLGDRAIEIRINWSGRDSEVTAANNSVSKTIKVKEDLDLGISAITPNADYREGTDVITSYNVSNLSKHHMTPDRNVSVTFKASYMENGVKKEITRQVKNQVVIPAHYSNLVYFKWRVPDGISGKSVTCYAKVNEPQTLEESNYTNNEATLTRTVRANTKEFTPNPEFSLEMPGGWSNKTAAPSKDSMREFFWQEWTYQSGTFTQRQYSAGINIYSDSFISPDTTNKSAKRDGSDWLLKSGYGINLEYAPSTYNTGPIDAITAVQRVEAYFPEFDYSVNSERYRTLEKVGPIFELPVNSNSSSSDKRIHFIPVWKTDGQYPVMLQLSDLWTPMGMTQYYITDSVTIQGSMYDDYYSDRR